MRLEGRSARLRAQLRKASRIFNNITRATIRMCDTLHLPARLVPRLRVTSPQPPCFRQRIATAEERDACLSGFLPNNLPTFATTHGY
jgi:hypothetical protein